MPTGIYTREHRARLGRPKKEEPHQLSPCMVQLAKYACDGAGHREICYWAGITERTLCNQLETVRRRLGVHSTAEMVREMVLRGIYQNAAELSRTGVKL